MVLKQNRNWQKRSRRRKDNALDAEERHDEGNQGNEKQEMAVPKQGITILEMTVEQFTSLFMKGYRIAKEEGFSEKDAEDFGILRRRGLPPSGWRIASPKRRRRRKKQKGKRMRKLIMRKKTTMNES